MVLVAQLGTGSLSILHTPSHAFDSQQIGLLTPLMASLYALLPLSHCFHYSLSLNALPLNLPLQDPDPLPSLPGSLSGWP